jgi:hypothetical protein
MVRDAFFEVIAAAEGHVSYQYIYVYVYIKQHVKL